MKIYGFMAVLGTGLLFNQFAGGQTVDVARTKPAAVFVRYGQPQSKHDTSPFPTITAENAIKVIGTSNGMLTLANAETLLKSAGFKRTKPLGLDESFVQHFGQRGVNLIQAALIADAGSRASIRGIIEPISPQKEDEEMVNKYKPATTDEALHSRIFYVDGKRFERNLNQRREEAVLSSAENPLEIFLTLLSAKGVDLGQPRFCALNKKTGAILMWNTEENLERAASVLLDLNQPQDDNAFYAPPLDHRTISIEARMMQMPDSTLAALKSSKTIEGINTTGDLWYLSPEELTTMRQQLSTDNTVETISVPRIATSSGIQARLYHGDTNNSAELIVYPYLQRQTIALNVLMRTTGMFTMNGNADWSDSNGYTNAATLHRLSIEPGGGALVRAHNQGSKKNNLVVLLTATAK